MTLKLMQGFETIAADSDFRLQGWLAASSKMLVATCPSFSGAGATALHLMGPGNSSTAAEGAAGTPDLGYLNTGITVNQAWTAGGFAFGLAAKFNSGVSAAYGIGSLTNNAQVCFDGTRYWAIQYIGGAYTVAYSTNLQTWVTCSSQPGGLNQVSSIGYAGNGYVAVFNATTVASNVVAYTSNNLGISWGTQQITTWGTNNCSWNGTTGATGNATYPTVISGCTVGTNGNVSGSPNVLSVGSIGGTMTSVVASAVTSTTPQPLVPVATNGLIFAGNNVLGYYSATASNPNLNTAGAWTQFTAAAAGNINSLAYNPTSNLWVLATSTGIWTFPNTGAAGTAVSPSGAVAVTQRYSTVAMTGIGWNGTQVVAIGAQGHIITSPDGITWTESGGHIIPQGTSGVDWRASLYDGSKWCLFSDQTYGVIATTPDLATSYSCKYVMDGAEQTTSTAGIISVMVSPAYTAIPFSFASRVGIQAAAASGGARSISLVQSTTNLGSVSVPTTSLNHNYELVFTKVAGTVNSFTVQLYVDGVIAGSSYTVSMAATGDTTSVLSLNLNRQGQFTAYDDIYFNLIDGVGPSGQLGLVSIVAARPTADVSDQWVKAGTAASNSLSVNQQAYSSNQANYVSSGTAGDKDVYTSASGIPANYVVKAVSVEAAFTSASSAQPTVNVGIISGSTESDSANLAVPAAGAGFVNQIYQTDPNGSIPWTAANAAAIKTVLNHVT